MARGAVSGTLRSHSQELKWLCNVTITGILVVRLEHVVWYSNVHSYTRDHGEVQSKLHIPHNVE